MRVFGKYVCGIYMCVCVLYVHGVCVCVCSVVCEEGYVLLCVLSLSELGLSDLVEITQ